VLELSQASHHSQLLVPVIQPHSVGVTGDSL